MSKSDMVVKHGHYEIIDDMTKKNPVQSRPKKEWAVVAMYDHAGIARGRLISLHKTYELAVKAARRSGYDSFRGVQFYDPDNQPLKKNPGPGPKRKKKQLSYGDNIFFRTKDGFGPGTVINPHYNIADYSYGRDGREYDKNGGRHIREVEILTSRGKSKIVKEYEIDGMPDAALNKNPVQTKLQSRPKPSGRMSKKVFTVEARHGDKWVTEGIFPSESAAREYATALDAKYGNKMYIRVTV